MQKLRATPLCVFVSLFLSTTYRPEVTPMNYFLLPRTMTALKGNHIDSTEMIYSAVSMAVNQLPVEVY